MDEIAIRHPEFGPFRLLSWRPLRAMGVLSYSLYLMHHVVLGVFHTQWASHPMLGGIVALAVCLLLASAIHWGIERPCARLRRRLSHAVVSSPRANGGTAVAPAESGA